MHFYLDNGCKKNGEEITSPGVYNSTSTQAKGTSQNSPQHGNSCQPATILLTKQLSLTNKHRDCGQLSLPNVHWDYSQISPCKK